MTESEMIRELYAKNAIREQLCTYAYAVDRMDREMAKSVFAEDSTADYSWFDGSGWEVMDTIIDSHEGQIFTSHQTSNLLIKLEGENKASSVCYVTACNVMASNMPMLNRCRYLDNWECRDGKWLIVKRVVAGDISYMVDNEPMEPYNATRDKDDPSYAYI